MRALRATSLSAFLLTALAAGCTLVNSLDDVKPADDGTFTFVPRPDAGSVVIEETGPPPSRVDAAETSVNGEAFSPLVVGGEAAVGDSGALAPVLTVLDSKTGREVGTREKMWVAAVAHDAPRDLWYIFEAPNYFIAGSAETVKLHIRKLDNVTGSWTELSMMELAPLVFYDAIAITNERLTYVAHPAPSTTAFRMITIDTSVTSAPTMNSSITLTQLPRGIVATRGSAGPGGYVNLYNTATNPPLTDAGEDAGASCYNAGGDIGNVCSTRVRQYLIPNGSGAEPVQTATHVFGLIAANGQPGYASVICNAGPDDVTILPLANGNQGIYTRPYSQGETSATATRTFTMSKVTGAPTLLRRAAVDNSRRLVFVVEASNDTNLYAVPINSVVAPVSVPLRHSGQSVYYDPASETVFAPFNQGEGFTFSPFRVRGTMVTPTLQERTSATADAPWTPPADLRPLVLGIRQPVAESCP